MPKLIKFDGNGKHVGEAKHVEMWDCYAEKPKVVYVDLPDENGVGVGLDISYKELENLGWVKKNEKTN